MSLIHGNQQSRKYQLTINNPLEKGLSHTVIKEKLTAFKSLIYFCMADEQAQQYHTHLYLVFSSPVRFSQIKSHFKQAHIEKALGTSQENRDYILKAGKWADSEKHGTSIENSFEEVGTCPDEQPGKRSDLFLLLNMIKAQIPISTILEENPDFIRFIGHIEKVKYELERENARKIVRDLNVVYVFGGKSSSRLELIFDTYGIENVYRCTNYLKNSFDAYNNESVICFDNFKDGFPIGDMLSLYLCGMPLSLSCRYNNKNAAYTTAVISSRNAPEDLYIDGDSSDRQELFDKLDTIIQLGDDGTVTTYTNEQYFDPERLTKETDSPFQ